jgi:hypothetical protein
MVDCFDRIHLRLAEHVMRPLARLRDDPALTAVTVRPPGRGPRILVEVSKTVPDGSDRAPFFRWAAREVGAIGADIADGASWVGEEVHDSPEAAYWAAIDAVAASRRHRPIPV